MDELREIFLKQETLQTQLGLDTTDVNIQQWYAAMTSAIIEIGEALAEDTRWKKIINNNNKTPVISRDNVIEETADVFIYLLNACIFYNISIDTLIETVKCKQRKNISRLLH